MPRSKIAGIGMYVPKNIFTNNDLTKYMETSDAWIQERTGIKERRFAHRTEETTTRGEETRTEERETKKERKLEINDRGARPSDQEP